ncbi:SMP-30/gluconolactonase/LRE family protein [Labrenzia sp. PHM005]|uniref:SMP-30/gluconolactonase/LRE family protein n=1 Tax=Labrenzia sp. PHM005 TaxID=2590016 RepID=UPI0011402FC6|nr:SMP-30/gluconolactonase/LRE family protein [Labrenzia sp. PHM005]QDG75856.1 SMP-30/gluconolactonase/LRE family protein [Labrenzia sp. PHM005]
MTRTFDNRQCLLGEGPLWHPERQQLFWFDILNRQLLSRINNNEKTWQFEEHVSAAGWISDHALLIASESKLFLFDIETGADQLLCPLEADNPVTRSNDGRADPYGGFWIGTMGKNAEKDAGAIYRYYQGELRQLFSRITISNAICFSPDGKTAYFSDTATQSIRKVALDEHGWPAAADELHIDLSNENLNPDGAVIDRDGYLWNAQWGASRLARYAPDGSFVEEITYPAAQMTCPAFGDPDMKTLFATSATDGLNGKDDGKTFTVETAVAGQAEHRVLL